MYVLVFVLLAIGKENRNYKLHTYSQSNIPVKHQAVV